MTDRKHPQENHEMKELPQEILIEIFSRLPAKSVGRCRCLAKLWRSLLSTPQFIKSHLSQRPHHEALILLSPSHSIHLVSKIGPHNVSRKLELGDEWVVISGSCDGLVLLLDWAEDKFLVNPATLEKVKIPDSPLATRGEHRFGMHGFGYDRFSDDYKIVTLSYYDNETIYDESDCLETFVDVYSVKRGVWKRFGLFPYDHYACDRCPGAFVNGAIHWLACGMDDSLPTFIAAFDLADEVFYEMPLPTDINVWNFFSDELVVFGGCLCMVVTQWGRMDAWIMKEYGSTDSWIKFSVDSYCDPLNPIKPLCFVGDNDDGMLVTDGKRLVMYNQEEGTLREIVLDGVLDGSTYVESLLSPTFGLSNTDG